ncbi:30S ribosomal protein S30e [Sulfodiicoccus acidiphilus]|nr:30S ribosomal protein S30e [Sulfodiicoccus acidiphilus]
MPSHGSLTKAGKVRSQTPKVQAKEKHKEVPRVRNREEFEKRSKPPAKAEARPRAR